jgi:DNA-binding NarL/FixJ family response regulator
MKFLIVDDSPFWRQFVRLVFKDHELSECKDGAEALDAYSRERPDWVFMDIHMAGLDGLSSARQIKARFPDARIIMVTECADAATRAEASEIGAEGYVVKEDFSEVFGIVYGHTRENANCSV